jgi:hypothetical protein
MKPIVLSITFLLVILSVSNVYAQITPIQRYDIAELMMKKYTVSVEQDEFTVFYRLSTTGALTEDTYEDLDAKLASIEVNQERQSLVIKLENVYQTDIMSMRIPMELISAEGRQLALFIDGRETQYEWSVKEKYNNMIFIVPPQTAEIEIVGTRVIPEFPSGLLVLIVASAVAVPLFRSYAYS